MLDNIKLFIHPRVITMLFLGFSAGVPILLIFSTLGLWLNEAGVVKSSITFFSWAALGYSFKFVWAPLVDRLPLPFLTKFLGRRRSWMFISQLAIMVSIWLMSAVDPQANIDNLELMAIGAVLLGFSSATQDIVIDAYRIDNAGFIKPKP
jgi:PAT family beta-lactamase induction signal transducer AmpG